MDLDRWHAVFGVAGGVLGSIVGYAAHGLVDHWRTTADRDDLDGRRRRDDERDLVRQFTERGHNALREGSTGALGMSKYADLRSKVLDLPAPLRSPATDLLDAMERVAPLAGRLGASSISQAFGSRPLNASHVNGLSEAVAALKVALSCWEQEAERVHDSKK